MDNSALLRIEMNTLWANNDRGRMTHAGDNPRRAAPSLAIGATGAEWLVSFGIDVADVTAAAIETYVRALPPAADCRLPGDAIAHCAARLDPAPGAFHFDGGVGYLLPEGLRYDSGAPIVTSASPPAARSTLSPPPDARWEANEWAALIAGRLGPWAMALDDTAVIAICHCARLTNVAAEAGVWTHPEHRGRRHAAAVTAAWATLLEPAIPHRFYSTSADNIASQRVAARLRAREIGWVWRWDRVGAAT